jgi:AcrR family transcriptional regulator
MAIRERRKSEALILGNPEDAVRSRILFAARATFDRHGFLRVTMEEIARDLGISKKTLYKHFATKELLVRAAAQLFMAESAARMDAMLCEAHANFIERLQRVMESLSLQVASVSPIFIREVAEAMPDLWKEIEAFRAARLLKFGNVLEQGRREGYIRDDVEIDLIVMFYMTLVQSLVHPHSLTRTHYSFPQIVEGILTIVFEGVLTKEGRKRVTIAGKIKGDQTLDPRTLAMMSALPIETPVSSQKKSSSAKAKKSTK